MKPFICIKLKVIFSWHLYFRQCADGSTGEMRCSQKVQLDVGERNWTLIAQNELGAVELTDRADLTRRGIYL